MNAIRNPPVAGAKSILRRALSAVESETKGLTGDPEFDLQTSNLRKTRLLLELSRLTEPADADLVELTKLREALDRNASEITAQLGAVRQVTQVILETVSLDQSDGTYARQPSLGMYDS